MHVVIIMDGNGRWAKQRLLPRKMGHRAGAKAVRPIIEHCIKRNVKVLTLFAFSSENWQRPIDEVETLMELFLENLQKELPTLQNNNIRLRIIGERQHLNSHLQTKIAEVETVTENNTALTLVLAVSYGGRWDICQAVQKLAKAVQENKLLPDAITEDLITQNLSLADLPEPDLLIRTSGEQRISNFLLWQLAYTEFYFTETLWPDFDEDAFDVALNAYQQRVRRFGLTAEQLKEND